jgi:SnoaL-like domain
LANDWVAAWNAHDLDLIMAHYQDAVELTSPVAAQPLGTPDGKVVGKAILRAYLQRRLEAGRRTVAHPVARLSPAERHIWKRSGAAFLPPQERSVLTRWGCHPPTHYSERRLGAKAIWAFATELKQKDVSRSMRRVNAEVV